MTTPISLLELFDGPRETPAHVRVACAQASRLAWDIDAGSHARLDEDRQAGARCLMLRLTGTAAPISLRLADVGAIEAVAGGGWLLKRQTDPTRTFWLPCAPRVRRLDAHARILEDEPAPIAALDLQDHTAQLTLSVPGAAVLDCLLWDLPGALATELTQLGAPEGQGLFLWGSHTCFRRPADVYRHLVHGHVYEDRYEWPLRRKTPSENDAHALAVCLDGLGHATGKGIYNVLRRQLLLAVLDRQDADGGYRHGEWTDTRESHFRLHASAMHLMMDTLAAAPDPTVESALRRAMAYATRQRDRLSLGEWFLHDELELSAAGMNAGPFRWIASRACGKSPTNMLVLNTHLDTLVALLRYRELTGERAYDPLIASARGAALGVLGLRPMEGLYALLFRLFAPTFLPTRLAAALPLPQRALKRMAWRYLLPWLPRLKARFPRLVMPGGYVDRDLSLGTWSHRYLTVNAMDLARIARRLPDDPLFGDVLAGALRFADASGMAEKWREKDADRYSIGFLVEALYQKCTLDPAWEWRARLAAQVLVAHDLGLGLSPSLLGHNREIEIGAGTRACLRDPRLRVAVIRSRDADEILVINPAAMPLAVDWTRPPAPDLHWRDAAGAPCDAHAPLPPRGWRLGAPSTSPA